MCTCALLIGAVPMTSAVSASSAAMTVNEASVTVQSGKLDFDGYGYSLKLTADNAAIANLPYLRVTYSSDVTNAHELVLSVKGKSVTVCTDISKSGGKAVRTESIYIPKNIREIIASGEEFTLANTVALDGSVTEIKELHFFAADDQAYTYYGEKRTKPFDPNKITFAPGGNAAFFSTDQKYGKHAYESATDSLAVTYSADIGYAAMVRMSDKAKWHDGDSYMRIVYSADTKTASVPMFVRNNANHETVSFGNIKKTDGFVLSDTVKLPDSLVKRYSTGVHNTIFFDDKATDSTFRIKEILYFPSKAAADSYILTEEKPVDISIMGENIAKYRIVVPKNASDFITKAAARLSNAIYEKTDIRIGRVIDSIGAAPYEIIIGNCDRVECKAPERELIASAYIAGRKIVITGATDSDTADLVDDFLRIYFEIGKASDGDISISEDAALKVKARVEEYEIAYARAAEPISQNYSFDTGEDFKAFGQRGGVMSHTGQAIKLGGDFLTIAESPLYDNDSTAKWSFTYSEAKPGANFGLMLRENGGDSYVAIAYDRDAKKLLVKEKSSMAFDAETVAECDLTLLEGHLYTMEASLIGSRLTVSLFDKVILETENIGFTAPGKTAFFAEKTQMELCELDVTLLSEKGRILGEAIYNETVIMERGGDSNYRIPSMICTKHGTIIAAANDRRYTVADGAKEQWMVYRRKEVGGDWEDIYVLAAKENTGYAIGNAIYDEVNDTIILLYSNQMAVSRDDGKTWETSTVNRVANYLGKTGGTHGASAGFVLKYGEHAGRIISPARFSTVPGEATNNLQTNHYNCAIYSDDGGKTWHTSGPVQPGTGEGTLIEREDGVIVFNSRAYFNDHNRRVAYSYDGGETFTDFRVDTELLEPKFGVNASMWRAEMKNGQVITLFSNPYPNASMMGTSLRLNMTVSLSYDEARSWATRKVVHPEYSAYSCLTYNPVTDTFFLMYENGDTNSDAYGQISVVEFNLEWLLA